MCLTAAALGAPVAAIVQRCGMPDRVASDDKGNHFVYSADGGSVGAEAVVDADNGLVHAIALWGNAAEALMVDINDRPHTFTLVDSTLERNDVELADDAAYSFGTTRVYGTPKYMVVASFDPTTSRLSYVALGEMTTLARLKLLPDHLNNPMLFDYTAPTVKHQTAIADSGTRATIVRVDIDREGIVRHVTVIVPSSDAEFDATLAAKLDGDRYTPATLMGRSIGGSVYREIRH